MQTQLICAMQRARRTVLLLTCALSSYIAICIFYTLLKSVYPSSTFILTPYRTAASSCSQCRPTEIDPHVAAETFLWPLLSDPAPSHTAQLCCTARWVSLLSCTVAIPAALFFTLSISCVTFLARERTALCCLCMRQSAATVKPDLISSQEGFLI